MRPRSAASGHVVRDPWSTGSADGRRCGGRGWWAQASGLVDRAPPRRRARGGLRWGEPQRGAGAGVAVAAGVAGRGHRVRRGRVPDRGGPGRRGRAPGSRRPPGRAGSARPGSRSRRPGGGRGTCASSTCRRWSTGRRCRTWCSEAVAAVCGSDDALADLVDRSLPRVRAGRYRMLDTILLYCKEKLVESGEELEQAHARHFLDLVHRADPHLRRAEQLDRLALLSAEHDNLVAALRWAARHDQPTAMRLVTAAAAHGGLPGWRVAAPRAGGAVVAGGQPLPGHDQPGAGAVVLEGARGAAGGFRVREHVGRVRQRAGGGRRVRAGG